MEHFLLLLLFVGCFPMVSATTGCTNEEINKIQEELTTIIEILTTAIPASMGFTYFIFSIAGFITAVWHMNYKMIQENIILPRDQLKTIRRFTIYQKRMASPEPLPLNQELQANQPNLKYLMDQPPREQNYQLTSLQIEPNKKSRKKRSKSSKKHKSKKNLKYLMDQPPRQLNYKPASLQCDWAAAIDPKEPKMTTKGESIVVSKPPSSSKPSSSKPSASKQSSKPSNPTVPPPSKPAGSLDTIRQAIERDRLEEEHRKAMKAQKGIGGGGNSQQKNESTQHGNAA